MSLPVQALPVSSLGTSAFISTFTLSLSFFLASFYRHSLSHQEELVRKHRLSPHYPPCRTHAPAYSCPCCDLQRGYFNAASVSCCDGPFSPTLLQSVLTLVLASTAPLLDDLSQLLSSRTSDRTSSLKLNLQFNLGRETSTTGVGRSPSSAIHY